MPERSSQQFGHEKLSVYQKALVTFERIHGAMSPWSKHHAFIDHLSRAAESILFNLAEGVRLSSDNKKALSVDYSIGSTFECAACLDIAALKGLLALTMTPCTSIVNSSVNYIDTHYPVNFAVNYTDAFATANGPDRLALMH